MPDNRLPTNQSLIDLKDSIDLLTANINRTASNIPYDNVLSIKGKIDAIDLTSGGTITGNLNVLANIISARENGTASADGTSYIIAGNDKPSGTVGNSRGVYRCYSKSNKYVELTATDITSDRQILLPDNAGTMALTSDITFRKLAVNNWPWNTQASFSIDAYSGGSVIVYGARDGRGFLAICPNNNNEIYVISNNIGCTITQTYDSNTGKHTITFTNRTSYTGSNVFVHVIG